MAGNQETDFINEFCKLQRPLARIVLSYPPSGDPNNHEIDAIIGQTNDNCEQLVAVETTLSYRGGRARGEAKVEEQILNDYCEWLKRVATDCTSMDGRTVVFRIHFPDEFVKLRHRLQRWLKKNRSPSEDTFALAVCEALRNSLASGMAEPINLSVAPPNQGVIGNIGNQVLTRVNAGLSGTEWGFDFYERHGASWRRIITRNYGINIASMKDAIVDKKQKLDKYRTIANQYGASEVWLLLVNEFVLGLDVQFAVYDEGGGLNSVMKTQPQFDEIHLLAGGPWPPNDLRLLGYQEGARWKDIKLWPAR